MLLLSQSILYIFTGDTSPSWSRPILQRVVSWATPPGKMDEYLTTSGRVVAYKCKGMFVRSVCIYSMRDLSFLTDDTRSELFVNKLYWHYEPLALDCLEWWFWDRTVREYLLFDTPQNIRFVNYTFYEQLAITHNHVHCEL